MPTKKKVKMHDETVARHEGRTCILDHGGSHQILECGYPETAGEIARRWNDHKDLLALVEKVANPKPGRSSHGEAALALLLLVQDARALINRLDGAR